MPSNQLLINLDNQSYLSFKKSKQSITYIQDHNLLQNEPPTTTNI